VSKKNPRKKRPNPAYGLPGMSEMLGNTAGNLMVNAALVGATLEEKMLVSALIPTFLKIIRSGPTLGADALLDKLYPEGVTVELGDLVKLHREPANASDGAEPSAPEANKEQ
jgi:hypothetical protein